MEKKKHPVSVEFIGSVLLQADDFPETESKAEDILLREIGGTDIFVNEVLDWEELEELEEEDGEEANKKATKAKA